jgi:transposase
MKYCPNCGFDLFHYQNPSPAKESSAYFLAIKLWKKGTSMREIARRVDRTPSTIHRWVHKKNKWVKKLE